LNLSGSKKNFLVLFVHKSIFRIFTNIKFTMYDKKRDIISFIYYNG